MEQPKVSVVVCTYNQQSFVSETIESVLAQSYPCFEVIVSDDGSTDDTPQILQSYQSRYSDKIKVVLSPRNTGIPANINRALSQRSGDITSWLDGDDLMLPSKLATQVALLLKNPQATGCYHDMDVFESESGQSLGPMSLVYNGSEKLRQGELKDWFVPRNFFSPSSIVAWSKACPEHGYDERLKYLSEVVFYAETFRQGQLIAIPEILGKYRRHANNITGDVSLRGTTYEYELMAYAILEARYPELYRLLKKLRISCIAAESLRAYRNGDRDRTYSLLSIIRQQGSILTALSLRIGLLVMGKQLTSISSSQQTFTRPTWAKRLAQMILR